MKNKAVFRLEFDHLAPKKLELPRGGSMSRAPQFPICPSMLIRRAPPNAAAPSTLRRSRMYFHEWQPADADGPKRGAKEDLRRCLIFPIFPVVAVLTMVALGVEGVPGTTQSYRGARGAWRSLERSSLSRWLDP